jgi:L-iditol 2-dehydrogenase
MRGFLQTGVGKFEERDLPRPVAGPGEVILRVRAALTCGTDLKLLDRGHARIALPVTMGHEACGEIVEVGPGVERFAPGDRVVPGVSGPCGECPECARGFENLCTSGHADRTWGAFAELLRVPASVVAGNLHPAPSGLTDEIAAFLDPVASVVHGWNRLAPVRGTLLVYGAGAVGLLWAATAKLRGVRTIVAARGDARRRETAGAYGARVIDLERDAPNSAGLSEMAVDCTGDPEVWRRLADLVTPGGKVLLFGGCAPGTTVSWDAARLHYSEISVLGSFHYTPDEARAAMELLASGGIDPRPLISGRGSLSDLPRFLELQRRGEGIRFAVFP